MNKILRKLVIDIARADGEKRLIPVVISTETPVKTYSGMEILSHEDGAIDFERANKSNGIPLLVDHYGEAVGRIRDIELKNKTLVGNMVFSRSSKGQDLYNDVLDRIITDISVGGERLERSKVVKGTYTVKKWRLLEASLTAIGADKNAGINRNHKSGDEMKLTPEELAELKKNAKIEGAKIERKRRTDVKDVFSRHIKTPGVDEIMQSCLDDDSGIERSRELLLNHLGKTAEPIKRGENHSFEYGDDKTDKFRDGISRALSIRVGCASEDDKKDIGQNPFTSYTPVEIARHYLDLNGVKTTGMSRHSIIGEAFITRSGFGATSSDFPNILMDVANKSMLKGYSEIPETWSTWAQVGNLQNFLTHHRVNLSEFDGLKEVPESAEYEHGKFKDVGEDIKLLTYGKLFTISRQSLINDNLSALGRIPMEMGRSASRKVGDLVYDILFQNPIMNEDGTPLFHADHNNLFSTTAPDVESLDAMRVAMGLQKGIAGETTLGIRPAVIIVPFELEGLTRTLVKAQYDPASDAGTLTPNPEQGLLTVVSEHRLSANSATAWYLATSKAQHDVVEIAFLDGNSTPFIEQQDGFTRDGVTHKVRIDAGASALDFRGLSKNNGV